MVRRLTPADRAALLPRVLVMGAVVLLHLLLANRLAVRLADRAADAAMPPRLQVVYLHQLELADPPQPAPAREPAAPSSAVEPPTAREAAPAQAPAAAAMPPQRLREAAAPTIRAPMSQELVIGGSEALEPIAPDGNAHLEVTLQNEEAQIPVVVAMAPDPAAEAVAQPGPEAVGESLPPLAQDDEKPAFQWPVSTRLHYLLGGNYRGEVSGWAQVEWINAAPDYQVNLDVTVGLPFAPLFTRQMRSDGRLAANGLRPQRYAESSQLAWRAPQRASLRMEAHGVRDGKGRHWPMLPVASRYPVQDSASQFVQLSWLFTTRPELLRPGQLIEFDLALPRRLVRWTYEVGQPQTVYTPFGAVEAVHVHPRAGTEQAGDLLAQAWFAPRLGHLPVRIRIEQSADVFLDLVLERRPELAAP